MKFAVGLVCVAACAGKPAPPTANVQSASTPTSRATSATHAERKHVPSRALTPDVVLATVRSHYIGGVERCYRRHLKADPSARGRVLVSFTVDAKGHTRNGEARGITGRVDDCITAQVARWKFPKPEQDEHFALGLELGAD